LTNNEDGHLRPVFREESGVYRYTEHTRVYGNENGYNDADDY